MSYLCRLLEQDPRTIYYVVGDKVWDSDGEVKVWSTHDTKDSAEKAVTRRNKKLKKKKYYLVSQWDYWMQEMDGIRK